MTVAQEMLALADELEACNDEARAFKPHPYMRMMERAATALRQAAAPRGREAICEICHKPLEIGDNYIFTKRLMHLRCALALTPAGEATINETERDWTICRVVDAYRAPRNKGDERTLSDFLADEGLKIAALAQAQEPGEAEAHARENHWRKLEGHDPLPPPQVDSGRKDDTLTDALIRIIDSWRKTHPDLSYFETLTVIEGIGRTLRNLRDDAEGRK